MLGLKIGVAVGTSSCRCYIGTWLQNSAGKRGGSRGHELLIINHRDANLALIQIDGGICIKITSPINRTRSIIVLNQSKNRPDPTPHGLNIVRPRNHVSVRVKFEQLTSRQTPGSIFIYLPSANESQ